MSKIFKESINELPRTILIAILVIGATAVIAFYYYATPKYTRVGFAPAQPVAFDHSLHAGQLGLDCRYCHSNVERSGHANVPATSTCMNCHNQIRTDSPALELVRRSYETGEAIPWVRVHQIPDFVNFNHSVHVNRGVSCYDCHGQVNEMQVVRHDRPLSMAFCLECHRHPEKYIRPHDQIFNLNWRPESIEEQLQRGMEAVKGHHIQAPVTCSGCHQ